MLFDINCTQCLARQLSDALRLSFQNKGIQRQHLRHCLRKLSEISLDRMPPELIHDLFVEFRERTGIEDPYGAQKVLQNDFLLAHFDRLKREVRRSDDPLAMAVALSIAGNIIDMAVCEEIGDDAIQKAIQVAREIQLPRTTLEQFRKDIANAKQILFLGDNCGEIVLDRILVEELPIEKVTFAARGVPILNDATIDDARYVGMTDIVRVIDNGAAAPGTVLHYCSEEFRREFDESDCVVSKGMGNFESLWGHGKNIYFLLQVKCAVVSEFLGLPRGSFVFRKSETLGEK